MGAATVEDSGEHRGTLLPTAVGWIALLIGAGYAGFLHQGLASPPGGFASEWWHPTQFILLNPTTGGWADTPLFGAFALGIPAGLIAVLVFLGTRSSIARALAISFVVTSIAFAYVGLGVQGVWDLFHWRFSVVLVWIGLAIGFAIQSPALSRAWLRQNWIVRLCLYVPLAFAMIALIRNATGTDETLFSNFSPWPAISVIGLEIGAYSIVGVLIAAAIGVGALTQWGRRPVVVVAGLLAGSVFPAIWLAARFTIEQAGTLVLVSFATAVVIALASVTRGGDRHAKLVRRAAHLALGAVLVITPIFAGRAWANADYTLNKFVRAKIATDALAEYFAKKGVYPERLTALVEEGYLEEIPRPRVGFDILYDIGTLPRIDFSYRGLGSSYVLEFVSTEWIQCAYNPPWAPSPEYADEYEEEGEDEYAGEDDESGDAWSCPDTRPELWGNEEPDPEGEEDG